MIKIFPLEQLINHFWDKPYQEINFKSHLNTVLLFKLGKVLSDLHMSDYISFYLLVLNFTMKLKDANSKSHLNVLVFSDPWKMTSDLNVSHGKMSDSVSFPSFGFTLVIKMTNILY